MKDGSHLLQWALGANAAFSGVSGLTLLVAAGPLGRWLGVTEPWFLRGIGAGLVLFAVLLARLALERKPRASDVIGASLSDFAWVAGSAFLLLVYPELLTEAGRWAVGIVALLVADFGAAQLLGLKRAGRMSERCT